MGPGELRLRAQAGEAEAQARLAAALAKAGEAAEARTWITRAADQGFVPARRLLGVWLIGGFGGPRDIAGGLSAIAAAAATGDPAAVLLEARAWADPAIGGGDMARARAGLAAAAASGHAGARRQQALLDPAASPADLRPLPAATRLRDRPPIRLIPGLLTPAECAYVMEAARPLLRPAQVVLEGTSANVHHGIRTNSSAYFTFPVGDLVLAAINARVSAAAGLPPAHGEPLGVLHYKPGETYKAHVDWFSPDSGEVAAHGQRTHTLLVYLNAAYEGGETRFERLDWAFKGAPGDALMWANVDETGAPDPMTLHAGLPPTRGEKWLISKWFRDRPHPPRLM